MQPADVGLNRVIKHRLKQAQMRYLVESHQTQIAGGLTPERVKITTSLPALRDASVAGVVEVYDFMTGPSGRELVKKVISLIHRLITAQSFFRLGKNVQLRDGTSRASA